MSYENETWAGFGKVCAWIAGIAAAGGALYWIGTSIYDSGRATGKIEGQAEVNERWEKENSALVEGGRLIPERECFRYHSSIDGDLIKPSLSGVTGCGFTLTYSGNKKSVELKTGEYKATLNPKEAPSLARKVQTRWEKIPTQ